MDAEALIQGLFARFPDVVVLLGDGQKITAHTHGSVKFAAIACSGLADRAKKRLAEAS